MCSFVCVQVTGDAAYEQLRPPGAAPSASQEDRMLRPSLGQAVLQVTHSLTHSLLSVLSIKALDHCRMIGIISH